MFMMMIPNKFDRHQARVRKLPLDRDSQGIVQKTKSTDKKLSKDSSES